MTKIETSQRSKNFFHFFQLRNRVSSRNPVSALASVSTLVAAFDQGKLDAPHRLNTHQAI